MRPAYSLTLNTYILKAVGLVLQNINRIFYKNWEFIRGEPTPQPPSGMRFKPDAAVGASIPTAAPVIKA